ncbi:hypothetical protein [Glaciecola petra]|uniref:CheW-like domain-containing protein n=1 Tax=Glaciecola petra TaxID=3075602 RepID=A0ABU2ZNI8_9ALTE|nr:hypothetical protein [Aestuariibacter sp. P117]MDT0593831.1 hypothetical protein [Aestuariibacter sp. P117]
MNDQNYKHAENALLNFFADSTLPSGTNDQLILRANDSLSDLFENACKLDCMQQEGKENSAIADSIRSGSLRDPNLKLCDTLPTEFQSLSCIIAGFKVSVPLLELGRIIRPKSALKMAKRNLDSSSIFKGVLIDGEEKFQCLNETFWFGGKPIQKVNELALDKYYLQLGKSQFVLECNELGSTKMLHKTALKWHDNVHHKTWLVGVVTETMEVLLDSAKLVEKLLK